MKGILAILATGILLLASCSSPTSDAPAAGKPLRVKAAQPNVSSKRKSLHRTMEREQVVLVSFANGISLHWDNHRHLLVADSLFDSAVATFPEKQPSFIALISDTTATSAKACDCAETDLPLVAGDVAFLLLNRIKQAAGMNVLGMQWDVFDTDCPYPCGMLSYVKENRREVREKIATYLAAGK